MKDYFDQGIPQKKLMVESPGRDVPLRAKKQNWTITENPETLQRTFSFSNAQKLLYFLEDVIQFQEAVGHHGILTINENKVSVRIFTKTLNRVTDLDVEWTKKVDRIFNDVNSQDEGQRNDISE